MLLVQGLSFLLKCPAVRLTVYTMKEVHTTDNQLHDLIQVSPEESRPYDGWAGFAGCGDGQDDFADYNAGEGQDW